jgi:hypothetical protein
VQAQGDHQLLQWGRFHGQARGCAVPGGADHGPAVPAERLQVEQLVPLGAGPGVDGPAGHRDRAGAEGLGVCIEEHAPAVEQDDVFQQGADLLDQVSGARDASPMVIPAAEFVPRESFLTGRRCGRSAAA